jgi:hypothetical protein
MKFFCPSHFSHSLCRYPPLPPHDRDAYFMRKDLCGAASEGGEWRSSSRQPLQGRQWRRGERERDEWLNRDASRGGSFFEGRKSMREMLSEETRAGSASGPPRAPIAAGGKAPSGDRTPPLLLPGKFQRSFRSFLNGGDDWTAVPAQRRDHGGALPRPWEAGPDGLRLPRYMRVTRASSSLRGAGGRAPPAVEVTPARGLELNLADSSTDDDGGAASLDSCVATGSV